MRILHIASFEGNIGDCVSHEGLFTILEKFIPKFEISNLEIRKFYQNAIFSRECFDKSFIDLVNSYDLTIIGGGGYMECSHDGSKTGTTFDIDVDLLMHLEKPVLFSSIGCFPVQEINEENRAKFCQFLRAINNNQYTELFVRNDGSKDFIIECDPTISAAFPVILDNGYFCANTFKSDCSLRKKPYIAINLGYDQIDRQIVNSDRYSDWDGFARSFAMQLIEISSFNADLEFVLVPHTPQDLFGYTKLMTELPDDFIRYKFRISELAISHERLNYLKQIYANSLLSVCSRLHSHILSVVLECQVLSFGPNGRVKNLISNPNLALPELRLDQTNLFSEKVRHLLMEINFQEKPCQSRLSSAKEQTLETYRRFFIRNGLV